MGTGIDLTGLRSGKLVAIEYAESRNDGRYWKCKCDCGNETLVRATRIKNNIIKSCGCLNELKRSKSSNWKGCGEVSASYFKSVKKNSEIRKKDIPFEITIEDMSNQFEKQNHKCAYTGLELKFGINARDEKKNRTASLDRINSSKGYTKDNIQWVHKVVNIMKNDINHSEFLEIINLIQENSYGKHKSKSR